MSVDLHDRVVDIDHHRPGVRLMTEQSGVFGQCAHEPRGDRIGLADVAEGELPQERSQRRRGVRAVEECAHRPVAQQGHVVDAIRACGHPGHERGQFHSTVGALVGGHAQMLVTEPVQARPVGEFHQRHEAGARHEVGLIERREAYGQSVR